MRVVLDTCVLIPTPLRNILMRLAEQNLFFPLWSEKIFEEWEFFVTQNMGNAVNSTKIEILLMKSKWKRSLVTSDKELEETLFLPDRNDIHVLATAITGQAQVLLTNNLKDFPSRLLAKHNIISRSVDNFLLELFHEAPQVIESIVNDTIKSFEENNAFKVNSKKAFLKKYGLTRLAKTILF